MTAQKTKTKQYNATISECGITKHEGAVSIFVKTIARVERPEILFSRQS